MLTYIIYKKSKKRANNISELIIYKVSNILNIPNKGSLNTTTLYANILFLINTITQIFIY